MARRELGAGEVRVLLAALALAVAAVATVGSASERAQAALVREANRLIGGDAAVRADAPLPVAFAQRAEALGLAHASTTSFRSMLRNGTNMRLVEVRALERGYPLRGAYELEPGHAVVDPAAGPAPGSIWLTRNAAAAAGATVGGDVALGRSTFRVAAIVAKEPDAGFDLMQLAPHVLIGLPDLATTGLMQPGARATFRIAVAGDADAVAAFARDAKAQLGRGQRLESAAEARPEIRNALARAERFFGLAALISVVLGAIAVALAARRHALRHLDACALMRCVGATQGTITRLYVFELAIVGVLGTIAGLAIAAVLSFALGWWLAGALGVALPAPGFAPAWQGAVVALAVLAGFAAPPVLALRRVSPLRVLRRDVAGPRAGAIATLLLALAAVAGLLLWRAGDATLATIVLVGLVSSAAVLALLGALLVRVASALRPYLRGAARHGLASLARRRATTLVQLVALGLGLSIVLLLSLVRSDLERWRDELPVDAPNRFLINAQSDQIPALTEALRGAGVAEPMLVPMVRARLTAVNGKAVETKQRDDDDERAQRLAEREFNLTWRAQPGPDDTIAAGTFWTSDVPADAAQLSVERRFAETLGWKVGDEVAFDIAGSAFRARVTSLRDVKWESFRPNFFVYASPGALDGYATTWITAFHLPPGREDGMNAIVARFPNLTIVDVGAILDQVRRTGEQVGLAVRFVFGFTLAAGLLVLLAAIGATRDERLHEVAVMRVLGARARQVAAAQWSEFALLGALTALVAAMASEILAAQFAQRVLQIEPSAHWGPAFAGAALGALAIAVTGALATRGVLRTSPATTLRAIAG